MNIATEILRLNALADERESFGDTREAQELRHKARRVASADTEIVTVEMTHADAIQIMQTLYNLCNGDEDSQPLLRVADEISRQIDALADR